MSKFSWQNTRTRFREEPSKSMTRRNQKYLSSAISVNIPSSLPPNISPGLSIALPSYLPVGWIVSFPIHFCAQALNGRRFPWHLNHDGKLFTSHDDLNPTCCRNAHRITQMQSFQSRSRCLIDWQNKNLLFLLEESETLAVNFPQATE